MGHVRFSEYLQPVPFSTWPEVLDLAIHPTGETRKNGYIEEGQIPKREKGGVTHWN